MKHRDSTPRGDTEPRGSTKTRLALAGLTLAVLSAITGIISYEHALEVVRAVGNTGLVAYLVPLVPDLTIVGASQVLFEATAAGVRRPVMAWVALFVGVGWTVAMNVAAGWANGLGAALIAGGIPVAFVLTFESLQLLFRRGRDGVYPQPVPAAHSPEPPGPGADDDPRGSLDRTICSLMDNLTEREVSDLLGISRTRIRGALQPSEPPEPQEPEMPVLVGAALNGGGPA